MTQHAPLACLAFIALVLPVALVACWPAPGGSGSGSGSGSSNSAPAATTDPPVIQSLDMTGSVTAINDTYTVFGSITYADDDDVVTSVHVQVPVVGHTYSFPVDNPVSSAAGEPFQFTLSADPPLGGAGPTNYIVTLVNKSGAISEPVEESVDLQ